MNNSKIKNIKKEVLSDNWYTLNKFTYDIKLQNDTWVSQQRESYDRGNGAAILLYNSIKKTVVLTKQFRCLLVLSVCFWSKLKGYLFGPYLMAATVKIHTILLCCGLGLLCLKIQLPLPFSLNLYNRESLE